LNFVPGSEVYGEKRISVEVSRPDYTIRFQNILAMMIITQGSDILAMNRKKQNHFHFLKVISRFDFDRFKIKLMPNYD
jgi:hypothetical protein